MYNEVSPGYFGTVGMRLLDGRDFTRGDIEGGPKVAIVNEAFARKFNLTGHVVGSRMASENGNGVKLDIEIVGLVKDAKYSEREARDSAGVLHAVPAGQGGRLDVFLRAHAAGRQGPAPGDPAPRRPPRSEPAGRGSALDGPADPPERRRRSRHHDPLGGLRHRRDAARGDRAVWRARLHRRAADARDRAADGARRRRRPGPPADPRAGRLDDARRRERRPARRDRARHGRRLAAVRSEGLRPDGARRRRPRCW